MNDKDKKRLSIYNRNFIFGIEDSLVSTVGLLSGVAVAGMDKKAILLTGIVLIFVEAFSMGAGSFLSEHSTEKLVQKSKQNWKFFIKGAVIMFFSYFLAGFLPLGPYIILEINNAFPTSIIISLLGLFALGAINSKIFKARSLRSAFEMLAIGGVAIGVGVIASKIVQLIN